MNETNRTVPPPVELGEIVLWYEDGDPGQRPLPALVTAVGNQTLNLNIFSPELQNMRVRDGVLHLSQEGCGSKYNREGGGWDLTPQGRRLRALVEVVRELEAEACEPRR